MLAKSPDLTIALNRAEPDKVMMGASTFDDLIKAGNAKFDGDRKPFDPLWSLLVVFTPDFEMLPRTAAPKKAATDDSSPFKLPELAPPNAPGD